MGKPVKISLHGSWKGYKVLKKKSKVRKGHAYLTSFTCPVPVEVDFRCLEHQRVSGDSDTGSRLSWSKAVDERTSARFLVLSSWFVNRDYFAISRTDLVGNAEGRKCISATMSISTADMKTLDSSALPRPSGDFTHGDIYMIGTLLTAVDEGNTQINFMMDTNPSAKKGVNHRLIDRDIRRQLINLAAHLNRLMHTFGSYDDGGSTETVVGENPVTFGDGDGDDGDDDDSEGGV